MNIPQVRVPFPSLAMRSELHRNQVTDAQTVHENLRDAAYHEAGHVVVARCLGLTIREVEIEEDGSGRADIWRALTVSRSDTGLRRRC